MKRIKELWTNADLFCKISAVIGAAAVLPALIALWLHKGLGLFCSLMQLGCAVTAILLHTGKIASKKSWLKYVLISVAGILVFTAIFSFGSDKPVRQTAEPEDLQQYTLSVHIDFESNLLFNTYGVDFKVDGITEKSLSHGEDADLTLTLEEGRHNLEFVSSEDISVTGNTYINLSCDTFMALKISCEKDGIEVVTERRVESSQLEDNQTVITVSAYSLMGMDKDEAIALLTAMGFESIKEEPQYDLEADSEDIGKIITVLIGGSEVFALGDIAEKTDEVTVRYHESEDSDPEKIAAAEAAKALDAVIPKAMAQRAVVVAMTNCQDTEVFMSDGNTYDPSKFHAYNDIEGFFCTTVRKGTWIAYDKETWSVNGMILKIFGYETYMRIDAHVTKDGDNYIVSNCDQLIGTKEAVFNNDTSVYGINHYEPSESNSFLTVPESLIAEDRDNDAVQAKLDAYNAEKAAVEAAERAEREAAESRQSWINSQFGWGGRHNALTRLIKKNLNDERSFEFVEASYIDISSEELASEVNGILSSAGYSNRVEVGDLFVMETFTAKNAFNARVKNTAYGIVKTSGDVILVGFE